MSRKRVKFTQYSLDRFLNYGQYNESLFDTDIKKITFKSMTCKKQFDKHVVI